jgi:preprotein translocase subunit SecB
MKESPISLLDYFATDLALATNRSFDAAKPVHFNRSEYLVDVAVQRSEKAPNADRLWQVTLDVRHQPGPETNFPYAYRVVLVGQFSVAAWSQTDEERTVRIHGASVLYGMTREIVRVLTGRGPFRPVILPTVSFYDQKQQPGPENAAALKASEGSAGRPAELLDAPEPTAARKRGKKAAKTS